jgi:uncharacterized protein (DUF2252 family)
MIATEETSEMNVVEMARETGKSALSIAARIEEGRALRQLVPRSAHAEWSPPADRPDPLDLLQAQDKGRVQDLVPIRYGRMVASPFTFLRGSATVMARDLSATPTSGLIVQACGDAHLSNFGVFGTPERNLVFDLNDFDETLPAPWEWDLKRLVASVVVASRANGFKPGQCSDAARAAARRYREQMAAYALLSYRDVWYARLTAEDILASAPSSQRQAVQRAGRRATHRDNLQALAKMTTTVDGHIRIVDDPPLIDHIADEILSEHLPKIAKAYQSSIRDDLRMLLQRYHFVDFARKVVGVGSVGTRCFVVLMQGSGPNDPIFLQIKQAFPSVLEPYAGKSRYPNHGQRVVRGQQYIQAASDIFLGWGREKGLDLYIRQLRDMKGSAEVETMDPKRMAAYGALCGWALARAHARSGDPARIAGYIGTSDRFDDALVSFATAYADQTERDHAVLVDATETGRIEALPGM